MADREQVVASLDRLAVGTMEEVQVGAIPVLVVRTARGVQALAARCPHYGAPLAEGLLAGDRIVCPWHHACFAADTGMQLEPPADDGLARYPVRVEDGRIFVRVPDDMPPHAPPALASADPASDPRVFVIVGAGAAGSTAAWTLRAEGFRGRIVLIGADERAPYDRTFLSKELLMGVDLPAPEALRSDAFWREAGIELLLGRRVARLDAPARALEFADGERLAYDQALLATGARPRRLPVPGAGLAGVVTLRERDDVAPLLAAAEERRRVVVVGGSFIAMEVAASLAGRGVGVKVIAPEEVPFAPLFGERVGRALIGVHEGLGTKLLLGRHVARFEGSERLEAVVTDRGERIAADLAVIGIGVAPATDLLEGVVLDEDGGVPVDAMLQAADGLFAAGDVARFPEPVSGERVRIEHWRLACQHGRVAARNMLGRAEPYQGVPFFWSAQKLALYYVGHAQGFDEVVLDGDPEDGPFIAWYVKGGRGVAALGVQRNREMCAIEELMRRRQLLDPTELRRGFDPVEALEAALAKPSR